MEMRQENLSIISHNRDEIELKIEYKDYLTPEQLSNFYVALNQILKFHNIKDVEVNVKEGSLITILKKFAIAPLPLLLGSFSNPEPQNLKFTAKIASSFNNNNFINFIINKTTIYNEDNIAQKTAEFEERLLKEVNSIEEVETLQMRITKATKTMQEIIDPNEVKEKNKFQFLARFDDNRYNQEAQVKVIINYEKFTNYLDENKHIKECLDKEKQNLSKCYFIADGVLTKTKGKYTKFEITNLITLEKVDEIIEQQRLI